MMYHPGEDSRFDLFMPKIDLMTDILQAVFDSSNQLLAEEDNYGDPGSGPNAIGRQSSNSRSQPFAINNSF